MILKNEEIARRRGLNISIFLFLHIFEDLLFLASESAFHFLDIFRRWKLLRDDSFIEEKFSDILIIFCMIRSDVRFCIESFLCDIMICQCCREVFRLQGDRRKMISEWFFGRSYTESMLHILSRMSSEKCPISTTPDPSKSSTIDTSLIE